MSDRRDHHSLPNSQPSSAKLKYLKPGYHYFISYSLYLLLIPLLTILSPTLSSIITINSDVTHLYNLLTLNLQYVFYCLSLLIMLAILYSASRPTKVYLVDFACYKPHPALKTTKSAFMESIVQSSSFSNENIEFQRKIFERSGIGEEAYLSDSLTRILPKQTLSEA